MTNVATSCQPKDLVMDLMRAVAPEPLDVKTLIGIGAIFGFNGNQMRVAVTRLCQSQQLNCQERGIYALGDHGQESVLLSRDWRIGEDRLRSWDGFWYMVALPPALERNRHRRALQALHHNGFRQGLRSLFVRPANLRLSTEQLRQRLQGLGLDESCQLWRAGDISAGLCDDWQGLWSDEGWEEGHHSARKQLEFSLANLRKLSPEDQLRESFILGGESIRLLVTDPLLPQTIAKGQERQLHTAAMQTYDQAARKLWLNNLQDWRNES
jgi:phenylacetic acid degradation operon negative regulatory protein